MTIKPGTKWDPNKKKRVLKGLRESNGISEGLWKSVKNFAKNNKYALMGTAVGGPFGALGGMYIDHLDYMAKKKKKPKSLKKSIKQK